MGNICSNDLSLPRTFVPRIFRFQEHSFPVNISDALARMANRLASSHTRTAVTECCKDNDESLSEWANFDPRHL